MRSFVIVAVLLLTCAASQAQEQIPCSQVDALVKMAQSRTLAALNQARLQASLDYRVQLVFASMQFKIARNRQSAIALMKVLPADENQSRIPWMFETSLCEGETELQEMVLARGISGALTRQAASAVLLAPEFMPQYVQYVMGSLRAAETESDAAVQMRRVCLSMKPQLRRAVNALSQEEKDDFGRAVMELRNCKPLWLPEAD